MNALMEMKNINKSFGSNRVLENVNVSLIFRGSSCITRRKLEQENPLLSKILGGIYKKDSGQIYVKDQLAEINNISDARTYGISIIHQELMLCSHISVAENIFMGMKFVMKKGIVSLKNAKREGTIYYKSV